MSLPTMIAASDPLSHVIQHPLIKAKLHLEGFWAKLAPNGEITILSDQISMMIAAFLLLAIFLPIIVRKRKGTDEVGRMVPTGSRTLIEMICQYLRDEVARPSLGPHTDRFIKYLWTVFFFILTMNLLGMVPFGSITPLFGFHIGGTPTTNIWVTATLAIATLLMMIINGLRLGGVDYLKHFNPGPGWLAPLMVPLEIIGTFAKAFALALRLFAAMAGGHILMAVLLSLILSAGQALGTGGGLALSIVILIGAIGISMVELFVAFLQAFIFTYLTSLFIGMSVNVHHDDDHGDAHAEGAAAHG